MKNKGLSQRSGRDFEYDICLSFAGEDRAYVRRVADILRQRGTRVFFDEYEKAELWGKDLYAHLDDIYQNAARYCVLFASKHFAKRVWTNHERQSAQARAIRQCQEYILPARFDSTEIPGLRPTVGYVDLRTTSPEELADLIARKLGDRPKENFFPPVPDTLFKRLKSRSATARYRSEFRARHFFDCLMRMSPEEREVVFLIFIKGCPAELPENVHINIDLLRRLTGYAHSKILRILGKLKSLGFVSFLREDDDHDCIGGRGQFVLLEWHDMSTDEKIGGNATVEADEMVKVATEQYCEEHALEGLRRLDFSQLSSATRSVDNHL